MKHVFVIFLLLYILSCDQTKRITLEALQPTIIPAPITMCPNGGYLVNDFPICNGMDGVSIGVTTFPSMSCSNGGTQIEFFRDLNNNMVQDTGEIIVSSAVICNGQDGVVNITPASPVECLTGGIVVNGHPVCNGLQGPQGPQGPQGIPGTNGAFVKAVKFCENDSHTFAEYGVIIGSELYGVYYGERSSHPHQIGFVRLNPGTFVTTVGSPKTFKYEKFGPVLSLTCDGITTIYDTNL